MGTFSVTVEIGEPEGTRFQAISALVDTGASYTTLPASILRDLQVPVHDRITFILADGTRIERDLGRTWIRIGGKAEITLVVFGDGAAGSLLGSYTLQGLLLGVDSPNERLVPVPGLLK